MPEPLRMRSAIRVCAERGRLPAAPLLPHPAPRTITIHSPTAEGDRAALIAILASILARVAQARANHDSPPE